MTEDQWLTATTPVAMCEFLRTATSEYRTRWQGWMQGRRFSISERKWRLFLCACCRRVESLVPIPEAGSLLDGVERLADGLADEADPAAFTFRQACRASRQPEGVHGDSWMFHQVVAALALDRLARPDESQRLALLADAARASGQSVVWRRVTGESGTVLPLGDQRHLLESAEREECARQADLLRDVMGNPFRPTRVDPDWRAWGNGLIARLAESIYEERAFEQLPILGDALEDAGCRDETLLSHCRQGGEHARGCWLVDAVLSKE